MTARIIVADNHEVFRVGAARLLGIEDGFRIVAQCNNADGMLNTARNFPGAIVLGAASLTSNWACLKQTLDALEARSVLMLENHDDPRTHRSQGFEGIVYRNVSPTELVTCLRAIAAGGRHVQCHPQPEQQIIAPDTLGDLARKRLTRKELQIVALLVQGYKNKNIADELGNTEQVIKNYMRSIFDKTGVTDRLELALFTIHHRVLLDPAAPLSQSAPERSQFLERSSPTRSAHALAVC